jgi:hypothetical protein
MKVLKAARRQDSEEKESEETEDSSESGGESGDDSEETEVDQAPKQTTVGQEVDLVVTILSVQKLMKHSVRMKKRWLMKMQKSGHMSIFQNCHITNTSFLTRKCWQI